MGDNFQDYNLAVRTRDAFKRLAEEVVDRRRPPIRYAQVTSIDTVARTVEVRLPGSDAPFTASCGPYMPRFVGGVVRIAGPVGARYVDEVIDNADVVTAEELIEADTDTIGAHVLELDPHTQYLLNTGDTMFGDLTIDALGSIQYDNALGERLTFYTSSTNYALGMASATLYYNVPTGAIHEFRVEDAEVARFDAAGLDVTGAITATGSITTNSTLLVSNAAPYLRMYETDGVVDERTFTVQVDSNAVDFQIRTDAQAVSHTPLSFALDTGALAAGGPLSVDHIVEGPSGYIRLGSSSYVGFGAGNDFYMAGDTLIFRDHAGTTEFGRWDSTKLHAFDDLEVDGDLTLDAGDINLADTAGIVWSNDDSLTYIDSTNTFSFQSDNAVASSQVEMGTLLLPDDGKVQWSNGDFITYNDGTNFWTYQADTTIDAAGIEVGMLRLTSTTDAALASTLHALQVGPTAGLNIIADNNEIMARNNGATSTLHLNGDGGAVHLGQAANNIIANAGVLSIDSLSPRIYMDAEAAGNAFFGFIDDGDVVYGIISDNGALSIQEYAAGVYNSTPMSFGSDGTVTVNGTTTHNSPVLIETAAVTDPLTFKGTTGSPTRQMKVRWGGTNNNLFWIPTDPGTGAEDTGNQMKYDFVNQRWSFAGDLHLDSDLYVGGTIDSFLAHFARALNEGDATTIPDAGIVVSAGTMTVDLDFAMDLVVGDWIQVDSSHDPVTGGTAPNGYFDGTWEVATVDTPGAATQFTVTGTGLANATERTPGSTAVCWTVVMNGNSLGNDVITTRHMIAGSVTGDEINAASQIVVGTGTFKAKMLGGGGTSTYIGITDEVGAPVFDDPGTPFYAGADEKLSISDMMLFDGTASPPLLTVGAGLAGGEFRLHGEFRLFNTAGDTELMYFDSSATTVEGTGPILSFGDKGYIWWDGVTGVTLSGGDPGVFDEGEGFVTVDAGQLLLSRAATNGTGKASHEMTINMSPAGDMTFDSVAFAFTGDDTEDGVDSSFTLDAYDIEFNSADYPTGRGFLWDTTKDRWRFENALAVDDHIYLQNTYGLQWITGGGSGDRLLFDNASDTFTFVANGNQQNAIVGAGMLRLTATGEASLSSTLHPYQAGLTSGLNVVGDSNEFQARDNGAASTLYLNPQGGNVFIGTANPDTATALYVPKIIGTYGANSAININGNWLPYTDDSNYYSADTHYLRNNSATQNYLTLNSTIAQFTENVRIFATGADAINLRSPGAYAGRIRFDDSAGTLYGYVGYPSSADLYFDNQHASGATFIQGNGTLNLLSGSGSGKAVKLTTGSGAGAYFDIRTNGAVRGLTQAGANKTDVGVTYKARKTLRAEASSGLTLTTTATAVAGTTLDFGTIDATAGVGATVYGIATYDAQPNGSDTAVGEVYKSVNGGSGYNLAEGSQALAYGASTDRYTVTQTFLFGVAAGDDVRVQLRGRSTPASGGIFGVTHTTIMAWIEFG